MQNFLLPALLSLFVSLNVSAQKPAEEKEKALKDSAAIMQDLLNLLDSTDEPSSYGLITAGIGNRLFSLHNNKLNAQQSTTTTIVYNPSIGYFHKSGFSLSGGAYLLNDAEKGFGITQYSLTPAFDLQGSDKFSFGVSYTRYFVKDEFSVYSSPIQNDFYTSFSYKKPWIEPGIALGYSTGQYKQSIIKDTTINNIHRVFYDSATYTIKSFSAMLSAGHRFDWQDVFKKADGFEMIPSLLLNFGSSTTPNPTHKTNFPPYLLKLLTKKSKLRRQLSNNFQAESLGLNIDCSYTVGNLSINPQMYFDYYLPSSTDQKFTQVFTLSVGYSF